MAIEKLDFDALASLESLARHDKSAEDELWRIVRDNLRVNLRGRQQRRTLDEIVSEMYTTWKGLVKIQGGAGAGREYADTLAPKDLKLCFAKLAMNARRTNDAETTRRRNRKDRQRILKIEMPDVVADKRARDSMRDSELRDSIQDAIGRAALSPVERTILDGILTGAPQTATASATGLSQATVSRLARDILSRIANYLE